MYCHYFHLELGVKGVEPDIINTLSDKLGFTWTLKKESGWIQFGKGKKIIGGTYGSVANNQSDFGFGHLGPEAMREYPNASEGRGP